MSFAYTTPDNGGVKDIEENLVRWRNGDVSLLRSWLRDTIEVALSATEIHAEAGRYPVYTIVEFRKNAAGQWYPHTQLPLLVAGGFMFDAVDRDSPACESIIITYDRGENE